MTRYHGFLLIAFAAAWTLAAIEPRYPHDWLPENYLVFIFVPVLLLTARHFRLSGGALHVVGSHYTYAEVPFGYEEALQKMLQNPPRDREYAPGALTTAATA